MSLEGNVMVSLGRKHVIHINIYTLAMCGLRKITNIGALFQHSGTLKGWANSAGMINASVLWLGFLYMVLWSTP